MRVSHIAALVLAGLVTSPYSAQAQEQDWSGYYGGVSIGRATGDIDFGDDGFNILDFKGGEASAFVGYNFQMGKIVYGGELAYSTSGLELVPNPNETFDSFVDLKGRIGYASGKGLYYGVLGYSKNTYFRGGASGNSTGSGVAYGIGAQYAINDRVFVGAELLRREINNSAVPFPVDYVAIGGSVQSVSIRIGMDF